MVLYFIYNIVASVRTFSSKYYLLSQEDACTICTCSKLANENTAHVSCTKHTCKAPVCSETEDMITHMASPLQCCAEYLCSKRIWNFGQVIYETNCGQWYICICIICLKVQSIFPPERSKTN